MVSDTQQPVLRHLRVIELGSTTAGFPPQADFDNVRLSSSEPSAVPEPSSIGILGLAAIGLVALARRKRPLTHETTMSY
jgi:PEP-CTERM motif